LFKVVSTDAQRFPPTVEPGILAEVGAELVAVQCKNQDDVIAVTRDADGVLASLTPMTRPVIETWTRMKVIARYGIGVDSVDLQAATDHGVYVTNVPDFCYDEVSDTAISLILAVARKVVAMHQLVKQGTYNRSLAYPIYKLRGKTLGLVAFGRIAQAVARKAVPFGLKILAYDPYAKPEAFGDFPVEFVGLEDLLKRSDVVSLHTPLNSETRHMIGQTQFQMMKPTAFFINTARGSVVDQQALTKALTEKWIAGAGLDVLEKEPPDPNDPILDLDNVVFTPHYASYSEEAYQEVREKAARQIVQALRGEVPTCLVNREVLKKVMSDE
jgi:D-3-phosphoglycerate dehydrogenase / 2-oxoglutarate reductase